MHRPFLISILIATKNRPLDLSACVISILKGSYSHYEILIGDQSGDDTSREITKKLNNKHIKHYRLITKGKSNALNYLIKKARGTVCVFTDDDCIADKLWLQKLAATYTTHPHTDGVMGKVEPYKKQLHTNERCPSIFRLKTARVITNRHLIPYKSIGMGNNMSYKTTVIRRSGPFLTWLGPGAAHRLAGGDESEYMYRALMNGYILRYEPSVLIYHNRWLTRIAAETLQSAYSRGLYALWMYYIINKRDFLLIKNIGIRIWERIITRLISTIRHIYKRRLAEFRIDSKLLYGDSASLIIGLSVGLFHALNPDKDHSTATGSSVS